MKIREMADLLQAEVRCGEEHLDAEVTTAFAGDMLSDVLSLGTQPGVLITGLLNPQVIRTAAMMDTLCVVFVHGKAVGGQILELAQRSGVCVLSTPCDSYTACGRLFAAGVPSAL